MDLGLSGQTALITGSAAGIGLAVAQEFAREGCDVVLWDQSPKVKDMASQIALQYGVTAHGDCVDVASEDLVSQTALSIIQRFGSLRHVVHCAAVGSGTHGYPFTNLTPSDWTRPVQVNLMGMVHLSHAFAPGFVAAKKGSFVFVGSVAGQIGSQTDPPYSATKAANINFAQCMAKDLAPHQVRVNVVCPGMVKTDLNRSVWESWLHGRDESERLDYDQWSEQKISQVVPLGRWQSSSDIANMVLFLASDRASQVTGQTINVDGGYVMR
ncbi:SDR family oxidoreductase [bacterium]|nr:SDR family oxidoreductase [bacterium]MDB4809706.1 SDR family oxidoreductase [bacterium]